MIESGSRDDFKDSAFLNLTWNPDMEDLLAVRTAFQEQDCIVETVSVIDYSSGKGNSFHKWPVIVVSMRCKRGIEGAIARAVRATRRARLALFQFTVRGKTDDGLNGYTVELRAYE